MTQPTLRRSVASLQELAGEKFGTIYADPPWAYDKRVGRGAASKHYDCMTVDEICALPVRRPDRHRLRTRGL